MLGTVGLWKTPFYPGMHDLIVGKVDKARLLLAEAKNAQDAKQVMDLANAAEIYYKRAGRSEECIRHAHTIKIDAETLLGKFLAVAPKNEGGRPAKTGSQKAPVLTTPTLADLKLTKKKSAESQILAKIADENPKLHQAIASGATTISRAARELKKTEKIAQLKRVAETEPQTLTGPFDVMVFDPPWPIEKIERDCRPNQTAPLDYPIMTLAQIRDLAIVSERAAKDCHVFLWTTQRFLPDAFDVFKAWEVKYCLTMVWHKPGGFQPPELPQFNCEFCLYGRVGSPIFTALKNFNTCFEAPRTRHSEKPEEFYELLRRVTDGRRLDVFNRRKIDGFDTWGQQAQ